MQGDPSMTTKTGKGPEHFVVGSKSTFMAEN